MSSSKNSSSTVEINSVSAQENILEEEENTEKCKKLLKKSI